MLWKTQKQDAPDSRDEYYKQYIADRLRGMRFALVADSEAAAEIALGLYPAAESSALFVPANVLGTLPKQLQVKTKVFTSPVDIGTQFEAMGLHVIVYCSPGLDSAGLSFLFDLRAQLPGNKVLGHADFQFLFDYLYNTLQKTQLYHVKPEELLSSYFGFERSRARVISNEKTKALRQISIEGKKAIELGCLHCGMTNYFLMDSPAQLISVEIDYQNIALHHAWSRACGHTNASILMQDFHALTEKCDVMLTYGVLYHSAHPFRLVEHLATLADTLLIGTHVWSDSETLPRLHIPWREHSLEVMVTPEYKQSTGGLCLHQTYAKKEDYFAVLHQLGFTCTDVETTHRPNGRVYAEFIAQRR